MFSRRFGEHVSRECFALSFLLRRCTALSLFIPAMTKGALKDLMKRLQEYELSLYMLHSDWRCLLGVILPRAGFQPDFCFRTGQSVVGRPLGCPFLRLVLVNM